MFEEFLEVIKKIKDRINNYRGECERNEALTRYVLIDPLLRVLDWDTENPEEVVPEFTTRQGGRSDYALIWKGKPIAMVEAEALNKSLSAKLTSLVNYCIQDGIRYGVVTDGKRWELYDIFKTAPIDQKCIVNFDLSSEEPYECALKALYLWMPNLAGKLVIPPSPPPGPVPPKPPPGNWISLANFYPHPKDKPPSRVRFPDGIEDSVSNQADLAVKVAKWCVNKGFLMQSICPIQKSRAKKYLINTTPTYPDSSPFNSPKQIGPNIWLDTAYSFPSQAKNIRHIIKACGQDSNSFLCLLD